MDASDTDENCHPQFKLPPPQRPFSSFKSRQQHWESGPNSYLNSSCHLHADSDNPQPVYRQLVRRMNDDRRTSGGGGSGSNDKLPDAQQENRAICASVVAKPLPTYYPNFQRHDEQNISLNGAVSHDPDRICKYSVRGKNVTPQNEPLYSKVPSYLTAFSHTAPVRVRSSTQLLYSALLALPLDASKLDTSSTAPCNSAPTSPRPHSPPGAPVSSNFQESAADLEPVFTTYSRLPAYATDICESLRFDPEFLPPPPVVVAPRFEIPPIAMETNEMEPEEDVDKMPAKKCKPHKSKVPYTRGTLSEVEQRCILFLANLPVDWEDPESELTRILAWAGLPSPTKIQVKHRYRVSLDSYAFIYFSRPEDAHDSYDYFQQHPDYKEMNVSFGGRDIFLKSREYTDLDCLSSVLDQVDSVLDTSRAVPTAQVFHPDDVEMPQLLAQMEEQEAIRNQPSPDFNSLLEAHMRWQGGKRD